MPRNSGKCRKGCPIGITIDLPGEAVGEANGLLMKTPDLALPAHEMEVKPFPSYDWLAIYPPSGSMKPDRFVTMRLIPSAVSAFIARTSVNDLLALLTERRDFKANQACRETHARFTRQLALELKKKELLALHPEFKERNHYDSEMKGLTGFHPTTFDAAGATQAVRTVRRPRR
jgi:hypothetical protein